MPRLRVWGKFLFRDGIRSVGFVNPTGAAGDLGSVGFVNPTGVAEVSAVFAATHRYPLPQSKQRPDSHQRAKVDRSGCAALRRGC